MITSIEQLHVGMNVRTKYGDKTWRVAAIDHIAPSLKWGRWVMLELMIRGHRKTHRFIHETEIKKGWLIQVEDD